MKSRSIKNKIILKATSVALSLFLALVFIPAPASAHVLKVDGTIGAVLHIDPNDSPEAGTPASIFFDLKDSSGKFSIEKCACAVTITEGDKTVFNRNLISLAAVTYTFPEIGLYDVSLSGSPKDGASFDAFKLSYDIRVETANENATAHNNKNFFQEHITHIVLFGGAIIFAIFVLTQDAIRRRREKAVK
jgi:hypothetical protein